MEYGLTLQKQRSELHSKIEVKVAIQQYSNHEIMYRGSHHGHAG